MPIPLTPDTAIDDARLADPMTDRKDCDPDIHGRLIVIQSGETVTKVQETVRCNVVSDAQVEYAEEHPTSWEFVFFPGDGDFGIVPFVPKMAGIDDAFTDARPTSLESAND